MPLAKPALDVGIVAKDIAAQLTFYRDLIGLEDLGPLQLGGTTIHRLAVGQSQLKLLDHATGRRETPRAEGLKDTGIRYITISVTDLDDLTQKLSQNGYPPHVGPQEIGPGKRVAIFRDPDDNLCELMGA